MTIGQWLWLVAAPAVAAAAYFALFAIWPATMSAWTQGEFGIVELATIAFFLAAAGSAARLAASPRWRSRREVRLWFLAFGGVALFVALEESSYGQHYFGWQSPAFFQTHNQQGETNLHNLLSSRPSRRMNLVADLGSAIGFVILPLLATLARRRHWVRLRSLFAADRWGYHLLPGCELVAVVLIARAVGTLKGYPGLAPDLNELREMFWAWAAFGYTRVMSARLLGGAAATEIE